MTRIAVEDLTNAQKKLLSNGCGGKGGFFKPPKYIFEHNCIDHDVRYWIGGVEKSREKADKIYYQDMLISIKHHRDNGIFGGFKHWWLRGVAWRYFKAVRFFGAKYFNYGIEKTYEDLIKLEMKAFRPD